MWSTNITYDVQRIGSVGNSWEKKWVPMFFPVSCIWEGRKNDELSGCYVVRHGFSLDQAPSCLMGKPVSIWWNLRGISGGTPWNANGYWLIKVTHDMVKGLAAKEQEFIHFWEFYVGQGRYLMSIWINQTWLCLRQVTKIISDHEPVTWRFPKKWVYPLFIIHFS